jgi:hypothetical protein
MKRVTARACDGAVLWNTDRGLAAVAGPGGHVQADRGLRLIHGRVLAWPV